MNLSQNIKKTLKSSIFLGLAAIAALIITALVGCGGGGGGTGGGGGVSAGNPPAILLPDYTPPPAPDTHSDDPPPPEETSTKAFVILVGMADYPGTINDLRYTAKDAQDVYNCLISSSVWGEATFKVFLNSNATKSAIANAFSEAKNTLDDDGIFLFYYSGHGTNSGTTGYIIPYDALTWEGFINQSNLISGDDLNSYLSQLPETVKKYVASDSCHSGYLIGARSEFDTAENKVKFVPMADSNPGYSEEEFARSIVGTSNCYVMTSSSGTELSWETSILQAGVFSYYLCQGLGNGSALGAGDINSDSTITAEELSVYVPPAVSNYISSHIEGYTQTPQSYDNFEGELRVK
ncbi:MAG: caspase family protein [Armatimonadota bacterium]